LKKDVSEKSDASATKIQAEIDKREEFFEVNLSSVSQPVAKATHDDGVVVCELKQVAEAEQPKVTSTMGPWSIDWLSHQKPITDGGVVLTSSCKAEKKKSGQAPTSVGFMKKIARMPVCERKQILDFLRKQKRKRKEGAAKHQTKATNVSTSDSSNKSSSSVNNDWENWVLLHGKKEESAADVSDLGKVVGMKFQCDTSNSFNLLIVTPRFPNMKIS